MGWPIFQVAEIVEGAEPVPNRKFFILETYMTSDGPRTRISGGRHETAAAAADAIKETHVWN